MGASIVIGYLEVDCGPNFIKKTATIVEITGVRHLEFLIRNLLFTVIQSLGG